MSLWQAVALLLLGAVDEAAGVREALALEQTGNDPAALAVLEQRIRAEPTLALPRVEAARIRLKRGEDLDRAELDLETARALTPENPRVHFLYGQLMEERGRMAEAVRSLERAVLLRADYSEAHERLAGLYFRQSQWASAELHYRAVIRGHAESKADRLQLAIVLEKQGRLGEAEGELKRLLAEPHASPIVARRLAEFYDRTDQPRLAAKVRELYDPAAQRKMRDLKKSGR